MRAASQKQTDDSASVGTVGRAAASGASWMLLANLLTKFLSFGAQVVMGALLLPRDFGLYALAATGLLLTKAVQDGGTREYVMQQGLKRYGVIAGTALRISVLINVALATLLAASAPALAQLYGEPELSPLIIIASLSIVPSAFWTISSARLLLEFRFRAYATIFVTASIVQYGGMVAFAVSGMGALSFVLPLPIASTILALGGLICTRSSAIRSGFERAEWKPMLRASKWLIVAAAFAAVLNQGDYLIIGALASPSVLGIYYFAYQIPAQLGALAGSIGGVLLASVSRLNSKADRMRALERSLFALILVLSLTASVVAATYPILQDALWGNKWSATVVPVILFCIFMPFRLSLIVAKTGFLLSGRYRSWAAVVGIDAAGLLVVVAGTGLVSSTAPAFAGAVGAYLAVSTIGIVVWALKSFGSSSRRVLVRAVRSTLGPFSGMGVGLITMHQTQSALAPATAGVATLLATLTVGLIGARILDAGTLRDVAIAAPTPLQRFLSPVLAGRAHSRNPN